VFSSVGKIDLEQDMFLTYNVTMSSVNINEIKSHFAGYLGKVANGETVIICKRNRPVAELRPVRSPRRRKRPIGLAHLDYPGFTVPKEFFEPLPPEIIAAFNGDEP